MAKKVKPKCKCNIQGVVRLYKIKSDVFLTVHPYDNIKWLRRFRFCPLCGIKLR